MRRKKLLVIAPSFPPRNDSQTTRTAQLTRCLHRRGWEIDVHTLPRSAAALYSAADQHLMSKISPEINIVTSPSLLLAAIATTRMKPAEFTKMASSTQSVTTRLLFPDIRVDWFLPTLTRALIRAKRRRPDAVLSCAYPYTSHLVAQALKRLLGLRWVADYGDPWAKNPARKRWFVKRRAIRWLEGKWIHDCDAVSVTTRGFAEVYQEVYPEAAGKTVVTPNAFDPDDFADLSPIEFDRFALVHTGSLDNPARDPGVFFDALDMLDRELTANIRVVLVGRLMAKYQNRAKEMEAAGRLQSVGFVPQLESYQYMAGADMLLLFGNTGTMQIPGKLYAYLGARKPILSITRHEADPAARIVADHRRGLVAAPNAPAMAAAITEAYTAYREGRLATRFDLSTKEEFSWFNATEDLHRALLG